ncbi:uncharacterized protein [Gossypium hirsutum]|uniref:CCHC-type domain-containing protein n=1 Tax=Gossypium hirsutum TaxID=3635 RepID=A0A1U8NVY3_GOSHI|nr:uncharacterized protein LOC107952265 [Gossypium hirsutum]
MVGHPRIGCVERESDLGVFPRGISQELYQSKVYKSKEERVPRVETGILELKEFIVLVERACKVEELANENRKNDLKSRDSRKSKNRSKQYSVSKAYTTSIPSVGNTRPDRSGCPQYGRCHFGECRRSDKTCFKCCSPDHFVKDCPKRTERGNFQGTRLDSTANKGRPQRNPGSGTRSKGEPRESAMRPGGRAPARTYAIRAREEASSPNVEPDELNGMPAVISSMSAQKCNYRGYLLLGK